MSSGKEIDEDRKSIFIHSSSCILLSGAEFVCIFFSDIGRQNIFSLIYCGCGYYSPRND